MAGYGLNTLLIECVQSEEKFLPKIVYLQGFLSISSLYNTSK
jgi:hypothetical protein